MELIRKYQQGKLTTTDVRKLNNIVLCLMISVAATSIVWSLSIHVLSGDFYNGFIGAKLVFRERDLTQMEYAEQEIWKHDLERVFNETYTIEALDQIKADALIMPKLKEDQPSTKKPKIHKIAHVFQMTNSKVPDTPEIANNNNKPAKDADDDDDDDEETTTKVPKIFNIEEDRKFLSRMTIDIHQTRWHHNAAVKFIYSFPFFSEIIAIIWTAMCFIFQSGVKKTWGLPKPWRIVIPSIMMFTIMTVANLSYLILANGFLKTFCSDLRENLSKPEAISCGDAMALLRPVIRTQALSHNTYLILFRISYSLAMILWIFALLIMLMRFLLAIDFQLVDVETNYDRELREGRLKEQEFVEVLLTAPQSPKTRATLSVQNERPKSEDDFQSAKSHLSEVATPLLDRLSSTRGEQKT
ncbi:hypothetical protein FF38_00447 [Lucilia cuprina]|uniref:Uncharacterized protein n=1 Tax=Lucilia cuprina TaxID=7375 RepID=A0A0L0BKJ0_LUCCU|nr:hypothetical protein FF38_00447 [Lucilia cuprina]